MARWILGQASTEEEAHGNSCSRCSEEIREFREAVSTFQKVMKNWSRHETVPKLVETPDLPPARRGLSRRTLSWAFVGLAVVLFAVIPIYKLPKPTTQHEPASVFQGETTANEDVLLMQEVTTRLSHPIPEPMQRVKVLLPREEASIME